MIDRSVMYIYPDGEHFSYVFIVAGLKIWKMLVYYGSTGPFKTLSLDSRQK